MDDTRDAHFRARLLADYDRLIQEYEEAMSRPVAEKFGMFVTPMDGKLILAALKTARLDAKADVAGLIERLEVEASPERREEILQKGWDVAVKSLYEEVARSGEHGDYQRLIFESWLLDGKDELLIEAAAALRRSTPPVEGAEIERLAKALEPFAEAATRVSQAHLNNDETEKWPVVVGHLNDAWRVLNGKPATYRAALKGQPNA